MIYKEGVHIGTLDKIMVDVLPIIEAVYDRLMAPLVITSTTDGDHKSGSLHNFGLAVDLRRRDFKPGEAILAKILIQKNLNSYKETRKLSGHFDVVLEVDHIHVEYDRRSKSK